MLGKKAMIFTRARDTISFIIGLALLAYGLIPVLCKLSWIKFNLPGFLLNLPASVLIWVIAVVGAYILIDGVIEPPMHFFHWGLIIVGAVLMIIALIPILKSFGVIGLQLGFMSNIFVSQVIILVEGLCLAIAGLTMH